MPSHDISAITIVQDFETGIEFHASYVNSHGNGHVTIVSNAEDGYVDLVINQMIDNELAPEAMVSLTLPPEAAQAIIRALTAGMAVAAQVRRRTQYN